MTPRGLFGGLFRTLSCTAWMIAVLVWAVSAKGADKTPDKRLSVAILPLENESGNPSLDHWQETAQRIVSQSLEAVRDSLRHVEGAKAARRLLKLKLEEPWRDDTAVKAAGLMGAGQVVRAAYARSNDVWTVRARVLATRENRLLEEFVASGTNWFQVRDGFCRHLLRILEIAPTSEQKAEIEQVWTSSDVALELYSMAFWRHKNGGELAAMEELLRKAIETDPHLLVAQQAMLAVMGSQGRMDEGGARLALLLKEHPAVPDLHATAGFYAWVRANLSKDPMLVDEARREFLEALRLDPDNVEARWRLAEIHLGVDDDPDAAIARLTEAKRLSPLDAEISMKMAQAFAAQRDLAKAKQAMREAEELSGEENAGSFNVLGSAYAQIGDIPGAVRTFEAFVHTARRQGLNPSMVGTVEEHLKTLRAKLTVQAVDAAMPKALSSDELQKKLQTLLETNELVLVENPLASSPDIAAWAKQAALGATNELDKATRLFQTLADEFATGRSPLHTTLTAREVFALRGTVGESFNCQETAKLFVAAGRELGLETRLVLVARDHEDRPVLHACAAVSSEGNVYLVDPLYQWFGILHRRFSILDDVQSIAFQASQDEVLDPRECVSKRLLAVNLDPENPVWILALVAAWLEVDERNEAWAAFERLTEKSPAGWMTHYVRGCLELTEGNRKKALGSFAVATAYEPRVADVYARYGRELIADKRYEEAAPQLERMLECDPTSAQKLYARTKLAEIREYLARQPH